METLPPEMVVEVGQYLTPRDLASCTAVCQSWRDIFNNNSLWQRHCDPSLAEPLENTPCVVEPRFVSPEVKTSRLTPISHWHMAFLREQHLWKNYKRRNHKEHKIQENGIGWDFLSNTLLVICFENRIDIWDVSTVPPSIIANVNVEGIYYFNVYRTNRLLVSLENSVKVFHVDPSENNVIELVHDISVNSQEPTTLSISGEDEQNCVIGSTYIHVNDNGLTMDVIDLENGIKIKSESCPVMRRGNQNATIAYLKSSTNSDCVIVTVYVSSSVMDDEEFHYYVYRVGQLAFSSGPIFISHHAFYDTSCTINGDYLAVRDGPSLKIYNCLTSKLVSESTSQYYDDPHVFNDSFVCLCESSVDDKSCTGIGMFSLANKSWTTVSDYSLELADFLRIINNKFIGCIRPTFDCIELLVNGVWEASGQTLKLSDIPNTYCGTINKSFTRGIRGYSGKCSIYYYW